MWEVWLWAALCSGLVLSAPHLGESTELAWLLVHESPPQQSPLLLRRITPKSVFLTPTFTSCSEGYRQDSMGRCVKVVKLNQQAQWEFFLQKLNSMYAPPEPSKKENTGPLKLPIPIEEEPAEVTTTTTEPTTAATTEQPTETPFLIVVANTTDPIESADTTPTEGTTLVTEETVPSSTVKTTTEMSPPSTTTTISTTGGSTIPDTSTMTTTKCEDCEDAEVLAESMVTESFSPMRSTVRFPDNRKRPSSYVRFPENYPTLPPYWWPHSWDRSPQVVWPPPSYHGRPSSYHRDRPHWSSTSF